MIADEYRTSQKLRRLKDADGVAFFCPGCQTVHQVLLSGPRHHTIEGKPDYPTLWPAVTETTPGLIEDRTCRSFITLGRIAYQADCTHAMAGRTVRMADWPHNPRGYPGIKEQVNG